MKRSNEVSATLLLASIDELSIWVGRPSARDGATRPTNPKCQRRLLAKCLEARLESGLMEAPWLQLSAMSDRRAVVT